MSDKKEKMSLKKKVAIGAAVSFGAGVCIGLVKKFVTAKIEG